MALPSTSNVLAVALVINRSRDGPRFVFHYPPLVLPPSTSGGKNSGCDKIDGDEEEEEEDSVFLDRPSRVASSKAGGASSAPLNAVDLSQWNHDDHLVTDSGTQIVPWEHVAGFPTKDLESILTPARAYHKRLFQVSLDPLLCVSYPIYVPENGMWRRKKRRQRESAAAAARKDDEEAQEPPPPAGTEIDGAADEDQPATAKAAADDAEDKKSSMTMFNLVFLLRPKKHEAKDLVDILFSHIIKKINKAYKYCQQRSDFVWKESKKILQLKDKGREDKMKMSLLWAKILSESSLAASMQDIYDAVSQNKIAALQLDTAGGMVTHSVQIPVPFHVSDLPQEGEQCHRGLWLTTANSLMSDDAIEEPGFLDKNFALLLLTDEKKIVAELQQDHDETTLAMIEFVRHCKPTLSFYQVGQQSSNILTPVQVRKFAQHFIFWRRAIAIPPLHARDMYIVSPNCNLRKLAQAAAKWSRQFPLAPALPNFLAELSVAPRPYKSHCPSKAHRPVYMTMLAWLMRGGWVTQLCTFAYVVVWPEIVYEVEYTLEVDEIARAKQAQMTGDSGEPKTVASSLESNHNAIPHSASTTAAQGVVDVVAGNGSGFLSNLDDDGATSPDLMRTSMASLQSLSLSKATPSSLLPDSENSSHTSPPLLTTTTTTTTTTTYMSQGGSGGPDARSSPSQPRPTPPHHEATPAEKAAEKARLERIADKAARDLAERQMAHHRKTPPEPTAHPSVNHARHLMGMTPHIILDAKKATGKESLYLRAIEQRLRDHGTTPTVAAAATATTAASAPPPPPPPPPPPGRRDASGTSNSNSNNNNNMINIAKGGGGGGKWGNSHNSRLEPQPQTDGDSIRSRAGGAGSSEGNNTKEWDDRVANAWPLFWKYFNGRSALERIALQEEMKRKDVWNLLTFMSEYLLCVRHW
ncbi:nitrogen permease regulator of amino acid transport activity 3-domain-containing protein [Podospora didyma]|uniref:Nitrogen permease regulator 3 n=1 Tax=Podospora didyma TaxID=330526 RepID=A0AAE0P773_9PEZI|nr:nitrogen permease regulator of amino acid transport activity 3-domain-containing protein [Podospora didyma]